MGHRRRLTGEFFAGRRRARRRRTIFAVGDEKQSIFSFQGAEPREFDGMHENRELRRGRSWRLRYVRLPFVPIEPSVLERRRQVFAKPKRRSGVTDDEAHVHEALPDAAPGLVEIWALVEPDEEARSRAWERRSTSSETSPRQAGASIAAPRSPAIGQATGRPAGARAPSDILMLVRQRGPLFEAIIRALKDDGIASPAPTGWC